MQSKTLIIDNLIAKGIQRKAITVTATTIFVKKQIEDYELRSYIAPTNTHIIHSRGKNTAIRHCYRDAFTDKEYQEFTDFYFGTYAN